MPFIHFEGLFGLAVDGVKANIVSCAMPTTLLHLSTEMKFYVYSLAIWVVCVGWWYGLA